MVPFKVFMVPFKVSSKAGGIASQIPRDTIKTKIMTSMMMWIGLKNVKVLTRQSHTRNVKATLQSRAFSNHYEVSSTYCQLSLHLRPTRQCSFRRFSEASSSSIVAQRNKRLSGYFTITPGLLWYSTGRNMCINFSIWPRHSGHRSHL